MRNLPPGRTARLWLQHRLATAGRGIEVLEQETHLLTGEERRLSQLEQDSARRWEEASREADRWLVRSVLAGGQQQLQLARAELDEPATARISWRTTMGVTYPSETASSFPEPDGLGSIARSGAVVMAAAAHRRAVEAALDQAAATRALALVRQELDTTRMRLRALENRWVPQLEQTLHQVERDLAKQEREDMVRTRWVAERREGDRR